MSSWSALRTALGPGGFVIIKATEGRTFTSPTWLRYSTSARTAKVLRGSYHFGRPASDPTDQADSYVRALRAADFTSGRDLPPMLDIEDTGLLSTTKLTTWCLVFCLEVDRQLRLSDPWLRCGVYAGTVFGRDHLDLAKVIAGRTYWGARWPNRSASWPAVDSGFPESAAIWQFADRCPTPGITAPCDGDVARDTDLARMAPEWFGALDMTTDASVRAIVRAEIARADLRGIVRDELHRFLTTPDPALHNLDNPDPASNFSLAKILQNIETQQDSDRKATREALAAIAAKVGAKLP